MTTTKLTTEETELYDRQIRAWGFEAQKRMRESKILILGLDDAGSELLKNLVLAGVGNITIMENRTVSETLIATHFYLQNIHLHKKWSTIAIKLFSEMNPNIQISDMNKTEHSISKSEYHMYDVIIVNGHTRALQMKINDICRDSIDKNIAFFSCRSIGEYGYMFADLGKDKYEYRRNKNENDCVNDQWFSLQSAFNVSNASLEAQLKKKKKKYIHFFKALQVCEEFENEIMNEWKTLVCNNEMRVKMRNIFQSLLESQMNEYSKIFEKLMNESNIKLDDMILKSLVKQWTLGVCPSNAMMGGYLANFVMFSLQKIQKPLHNFLFFNMWECEAIQILIKEEVSTVEEGKKKSLVCDISLIGSSDEVDDDDDLELVD